MAVAAVLTDIQANVYMHDDQQRIDPRARGWLFTLNNPADADDIYEHEFNRDDHVRYYVFQREEGAAEGTPHLQGYLYFTNARTLTAVRGIDCLSGAHWERRRGTHKQARDYCMKEDTRVSGPFEGGEPPEQGRRNDLHALVDYVIANPEKSLEHLMVDVELRYAVFKYYSHVLRLRHVLSPKRNFLTQSTWLYGATGTGKSHLARRLASENGSVPCFYKMLDNRWWDGYAGENVVFDDFASSTSYRQLLRILDEYPLSVECKGGTLQFGSRIIIITSHDPPWDQYPGTADKSELRRRLRGRVFHCDRIGSVLPAQWPRYREYPAGHSSIYVPDTRTRRAVIAYRDVQWL